MTEIIQFSDLKNCLASQFILLSLQVFAMVLSDAELPQVMKSIPQRDKALDYAIDNRHPDDASNEWTQSPAEDSATQ